MTCVAHPEHFTLKADLFSWEIRILIGELCFGADSPGIRLSRGPGFWLPLRHSISEPAAKGPDGNRQGPGPGPHFCLVCGPGHCALQMGCVVAVVLVSELKAWHWSGQGWAVFFFSMWALRPGSLLWKV